VHEFGPIRNEPDFTIIGGGVVGSALAYGLARAGKRVCILDEGDIAYRASRGNFALIWVQSKGMGMPEYAAWSKRSAGQWRELAAHLREDTGIDVSLSQPGGFTLCLSEPELEARALAMKRLHNQPDMVRYPYEVLDHAETKRRLPAIGKDVVGSVYTPVDGHVNSLRLFRALHTGLAHHDVEYRPTHSVEEIIAESDGFRIKGAWGEIHSPKLLLAAGLGNARLAPMVGLNAPVRPSKGQIIVTEKTARFLDYPVVTVRQTDEGGVMLGDSQEEAGFDTSVGISIMSVIAERAVRMFPRLAGLNAVRSWSALRVMSPDGFPIYEQSKAHPGAFVVTCHSGVTLAANHALTLAPDLAAGRLPDGLDSFHSRRFHVQAHD
jgi:hydrogen cyanide synthase HcnC